jgi:hypothetical protein
VFSAERRTGRTNWPISVDFFCCYLWLILRNYLVSGELQNVSRVLQCVSTQSIKTLHKLMTIIIIIIIVLIVITFKTGYLQLHA